MVLQCLWTGGPMTVRQLVEALRPRRRLAYTTVLTIVQVLLRKGWLRRMRIGRADRYQTVLDAAEARRMILRTVIDRYFDGSAAGMSSHLKTLDGAQGQPE